MSILVPGCVSELVGYLDRLDPERPIYLDTETTGLNPRTCKLVAVQLWQEGHDALVIDWRDMGDRARERVVALLGSLFKQATRLVLFNAKFDVAFLLAQGIRIEGKRLFDCKLAEQLIVGMGGSDAAANGIQYTLAATLKRECGIEMSKEERNWFIDLDSRPEDWDAAFPEEQLRYMALDVEQLAPLYEVQLELLEERGLRKIAGLEMRVIPALAQMEMAGVRIDVDGWRAVIADKAQEAAQLEAEAQVQLALPILQMRIAQYDRERAALDAWEADQKGFLEDRRVYWEHNDWNAREHTGKGGIGWGEFKQRELATWKAAHPRPKTPKQDTSLPNIGSSTQLLEAFALLGIPASSTDSDVLDGLRGEYPAVDALLRWRKASKFVTSFGENLLARVEADGRVHPDYQQIGASTGRMSCTHPNWQQIPARGDGSKLRACVVPGPGNALVTADFSNIELRILAALSQDKTLIGWFSEGLDMHAELAYRVFGLDRSVDVKTAEFTPGWSYRQTMKTINYGLVYGMSSMKLARTVKVDPDKAEAIMADYFRELPGVQKWLARQREGVLRGDEPVTRTNSGRQRRYHVSRQEVQADRRLQGRIQRQAMNSPIQGLSADITKLAVALFHERTDPRVGRLVAVVHDELVVEAPEFHAGVVAEQLMSCMDDAQRYFVKLPAEALPRPVAKVSDHWEH